MRPCVTRSRQARSRKSGKPPIRRSQHRLTDRSLFRSSEAYRKIFSPASTSLAYPREPVTTYGTGRACLSASRQRSPGHDGEMIRPAVSRSLGFEGELAVVVGSWRPAYPGRARPGAPVGRLHLLRRRQGARLSENLRDLRARSFPRPDRSVPGLSPPTRLLRCRPSDARHAPQRTGGAEVRHQFVIHSCRSHRLLLRHITPLAAGDVIRPGTPDGVGCMAAIRPCDENRGHARGGDLRHRHAAGPRGRQKIAGRCCVDKNQPAILTRAVFLRSFEAGGRFRR